MRHLPVGPVRRGSLSLGDGSDPLSSLIAAIGQEARMDEEAWAVDGLSGSFATPRGGRLRSPIALLVAGSGPTPRDGGFGTLKQIAEGLAVAGIRSYRFDKRGVGGSR